MGDPAPQDDAATLRTKLAEAGARIENLRRQQAEAKAKAKAVIQKQRQQAAEKAKALEEENKRQVDELEAVKALLRESDAAKLRFAEEKEALQTLVSRGKGDLTSVLNARDETEQKLKALLRDKAAADDAAEKERGQLQTRVAALQGDLRVAQEKLVEKRASDSNSVGGTDGNALVAEGTFAAVKEQLEEANQQVADLRTTCEQLRNENTELAARVASAPEGKTGASGDRPVSEIWLEVRQAKEQADEFSQQLTKAKGAMKLKDDEHEKVLLQLTSEKTALTEKLSSSEDEIEKLRSDLEKNEIALKSERESLSVAKKNAAESNSSGDEGKKILEAKIAEMERLLAAKQADIVKVRDKAKSYLKDINAEKREMEEKMKREVESLRKEVESEQENVKLAEQRVDSASSELDSCLSLIREKQKSLQMLKMSVSSEQNATKEARRETEDLRREYNAYKERARIALQEKQSAASDSDTAVEEATAGLRSELDKARKDVHKLRLELATAKEMQGRVQELSERAEKAEAAAELLKNDSAGAQSANYSQIDMLEEKLAALGNDVTVAQTAVEDAEARHDTTRMRLEATERALRATELRAEEAHRVSNNTIEGLKRRAADLGKNLERAQESSAAAQRTAAVAAKALAYTNPTAAEEPKQSPRSSPQRNSEVSPNRRDSLADGSSLYSGSTGLSTGRSTLSVAIEGHSGSLGFGMSSPTGHANGDVGLSEADIVARDKQIVVLTTQVAELGALLDDVQQETNLKSQQTELLKSEVKNLDAKLAAAEKLQNGAPFSYLRTIVVRYLETDDATLLPVIANVLSFTEEEASRVRAGRKTSSQAAISGSTQNSGYFSIPFLGSR